MLNFMKNLYILLTFFILTSCTTFETKILDDPKYASGKEYGTNKKIEPRIFKFDNYTFVTGYSDSAATLGLYHKDRIILFETSVDGYFDTIVKANFNNDNIPDFIIENAFEDGSSLYALTSIAQDIYKVKNISDNYWGVYCIEQGDTLQNLQPLILADLDKNGSDEVLINMVKIDNKLIGIRCSDTVFVDN